MKYTELKTGMSAEVTKTITEDDVNDFARISTDFNPIHINEDYAKTTDFGHKIAHGMLVSGLISAVLAAKLPGPGCIYLGQELRFCAPVYIGDTVTARAEITELKGDKMIVKLDTVCTNQRGEQVITGTATVKHAV